MESENSNLFFTLLKLKSYLVSLLDDPSQCDENFTYTSEYLERRLPEKKNDILSLLEDNGIYNDRDIAFNEKILVKFRSMAKEVKSSQNLVSMLTKLEIESRELNNDDRNRSEYITKREENLSKILEILFQLATNWAVLRELEDRVDNYSALNDEDVIRPDEEVNLNNLDNTTEQAFSIISDLTKKYIHLLTDYYFTYGGDLSLLSFVEELEKTKNLVSNKYADLFRRYGLDSDLFKDDKK